MEIMQYSSNILILHEKLVGKWNPQILFNKSVSYMVSDFVKQVAQWATIANLIAKAPYFTVLKGR